MDQVRADSRRRRNTIFEAAHNAAERPKRAAAEKLSEARRRYPRRPLYFVSIACWLVCTSWIQV